MDENHQGKTGSKLSTTEDNIWLPPLSPKEQKKAERLHKKSFAARIGVAGKTPWDFPLIWVFFGMGMFIVGVIGVRAHLLPVFSSLLVAGFFLMLVSLVNVVLYAVSKNRGKTALKQQGQGQRSATPLQAPVQKEAVNETQMGAQSFLDKPSIVPSSEKKVSLSQQQRVQNAPPPKEDSPPTLSIFVSHSSKDDDFGQKLVHDLHKAFQSEEAIWYDSEGGLYGGDPWWSRIVSSLEACDVFVIVLSPNSVKSKWVMRELDIAVVEGKRIVPIHYRQCDIRPDLRAIQIISFLEPISYEAAFNKLLQAIRH